MKLFVALLLTLPISVFADRLVRQCRPYLDLEAELECYPHTTYLTRYGYHYCEKFKARLPQWDSQLSSWAKRTLGCLQDQLQKERVGFQSSVEAQGKKVACRRLEAKAYQSHVECYVNGGFCELSAVQKISILDVVSASELLRILPDGKSPVAELFRQCSRQ